jgi:lipoprotein-anchoring transpeptidase ErfK/SrfK
LFVAYTITPEDAKGPFVEYIPEDFMEKTKLQSLGYTSLLELLGEKFHVSTDLLTKLNPGAAFRAGEEILVPNVATSHQTPKGNGKTTVVVSAKESNLHVKNAEGQTIFYAPATAGSDQQPLPTGNWKVKKAIKSPVFYYNPELFWDGDPSHSKGKIAPGPNNPVGVLWVDLSIDHYGIHGTPLPGSVGHSQSHGCVRLTNWDALRLATLIGTGTDVLFTE